MICNIDKLIWFEEYSLSFTNDNSNMNEFIIKFNSKLNDKNMENKINQIEKDYQDKLDNIEQLCNNLEEVINIKSKNSLIILQKELEIIKLLTKYTLQNKNLNYIFFISCLNILLDFSETLRIRLNQKELILENKNQNSDIYISRCSYKFCSYQDNCSYNYNIKCKNLCYQDHYVHNMVSADLKILINYINIKYSKNNLLNHNKEILKTINTLSYVIGHMETELKNKCLYLPDNKWDSCHYIKNK